jgi:hypothetical protein
MAGVTCVFCQTENPEGEQLCRECFRKLPATGPGPEPEPAAGPGPTPEPDPEPAPEREPAPDAADEVPACPHCDAEVPDPRNQVCVECHGSLVPAVTLRVSFPAGEAVVPPGQEVPVGRDPASSPVAGLVADRDNVSRLHATIGVDAAGAWIRDERSTNGTYVNDVPVSPGTQVRLADGDTLRLAADVTAAVHVDQADPAQ